MHGHLNVKSWLYRFKVFQRHGCETAASSFKGVDESAGEGEGASSVMKWVAARHTKRQDAWRTIFSFSSRSLLICMTEFP